MRTVEQSDGIYATVVKPGMTVQTGDGMLHRVVSVDLMALIKPIGDTAALPISVSTHTVVPWVADLDTRAQTAYLEKAEDSSLEWALLPEWKREAWRCEVDETRDPRRIAELARSR